MSIDIDLSIDTGNGLVSVIDVGNYTHNCQRMWSYALEKTEANITRLCDFHGLNAFEAFPMLVSAVAHMDDPSNEAIYEAMNPANGWGDFETAREYLRKLMEACGNHPKCTIQTDC